jgi:LytS/YehU family sensor histidine kinase
MFGGVGLAFKILYLWFKSQKQITELENLNLSIELQNLKNQISPHFLFNTLNNLYILSKTKPQSAPEAILNLSDLMRYQLYDNQKEFVLINSEVDYLKSMLQLEKIRKDDLEIQFETNIEDISICIQPMIFAPLVENAIKHGSQKNKKCIIKIKISTYADIIDFKISNTMMPLEVSPRQDGIGLKNLKRRLQIAYPNAHSLALDMNNGMFNAHLVLRLL